LYELSLSPGNWEEFPRKILPINDTLTEKLQKWSRDIEELPGGYFYKAELSTSLTDIVTLEPNRVKFYPSRLTMTCGQLADSIRNRVKGDHSVQNDINGPLNEICQLYRDSNTEPQKTTEPPTEPTIETPTEPTTEPTIQ